MQALELEHILSLLRKWQKERGPVRIISLHPRDLREHLLSQSLASSLGVSLDPLSSLHVLSSCIREATCVLTQRYHGALTALACGVPFVALRMEEGDKLDTLAGLCGCPSESLNSLSEETVFGTDWEKLFESLPHVRERCRGLVRAGEEALRMALRPRRKRLH